MFAIFETLGCVFAKPPHPICMPMHIAIVDSLILLNYNIKFQIPTYKYPTA